MDTLEYRWVDCPMCSRSHTIVSESDEPRIWSKICSPCSYSVKEVCDMSDFKKAVEAYEQQKAIGDQLRDIRYNDPKGKPKASDELIHETIDNTEIYRQAKEYILNAAQPEQVGYGLDKYPEPLNADTWTIIESIDHIISESVDKLHYLVMLRIQLLQLFGDDSKLDPRSLKALDNLFVKGNENVMDKTTVALYNDDGLFMTLSADDPVMDGSSQHVRLRPEED